MVGWWMSEARRGFGWAHEVETPQMEMIARQLYRAQNGTQTWPAAKEAV